MAETAIAVALAVFEGVMIYFHRKKFNPKPEVKYGLEEAQTWLTQMQNTLTKLEDQIEEGIQEVELYAEQVQHIAFDIEDAINQFMFHMLSHQNMFDKVIYNASSKLSSDFNKIMIKKSKLCLEEIPQISSRSGTWSNQGIPEDDELVGFETHEEKLLEELRTTDQSRPVIFVVGPGGSGKSSLVGKVYRIFEAEDTFSVHNWVEVPKMMNELEASRQPESSVQGQTDPAEKLRVLVNNKKYLVVLDDNWRKEDLNTIVKALPHSTPGSSIIITSRNTAVASWLSPKYIHDLSSGLSWGKGKELFCKRAFHDGQGNWPEYLDTWANKILKKCEGIPLPISAIGTALLEKETPVQWKMLHDSLGSELWREGSDLLVIRSNLQPSYRDLSNHLKSCFLYFSMFPEGYNISRERLIRMWVAEKFVISERGKTDNQVGEEYLNDLVSRNLVVAFRDSVGVRVRSCRVLELVREINSSRRKSFLTVLEPDYRRSGEKIRRLSAHNGGLNLITGMTSRIRTLLAFGKTSSLSQIEKVLKTSKFLKVLDLEGVPDLVEFPEHVVDLILLTYLSLRKTKVKRVPKSIQKLVLLETLDLKRTQVTKLPEEICQLHNLHHLLVKSYDSSSKRFNGVDISRHVGDLSAIQKLSLIKVDNREILIALGKLKGLRKLGLVEFETKHGKDLCIALEKMEHLSTLDVGANGLQVLDLDHMEDRSPPLYLQTLYLRGRLQGLPKWISKLTSLRKIGIHWSKLIINPLEVLQDLPNLIELDLLDYYTGEELVFRADTFSKLLILNIERFEKLKSFEVEEKAMPRLKKLTISNCSCLTLVLLPEELIGVLKSENNRRLQTGPCIRKKQKIAAEEVKGLNLMIQDGITTSF